MNTIPSIFNSMDNIMGRLIDNELYSDFWEPSYDVFTKDKEYIITIDLPGLDKDGINLEIKDQILSISGDRKVNESISDGYHSLKYGKFYKQFNIPEDVQEKNIGAHFKNGVLDVSLPRKKEVKTKAKKIAIS
tara:strand:- start:1127 stop:1525 length:399 start_codon:yes stop_codon:yes gene_type:complete